MGIERSKILAATRGTVNVAASSWGATSEVMIEVIRITFKDPELRSVYIYDSLDIFNSLFKTRTSEIVSVNPISVIAGTVKLHPPTHRNGVEPTVLEND